MKDLSIDKYCRKCRKFETYSELKTKEPRNCLRYMSTDEKVVCPRFRKIFKYLKEHYPIINKIENLYEELNDSIRENPFEVSTIINSEEEFSYWSVRIFITSKEKITRSREIWRSKTEEEANKVRDFLNEINYYWIPTESKGEVFVEKIYL